MRPTCEKNTDSLRNTYPEASPVWIKWGESGGMKTTINSLSEPYNLSLDDVKLQKHTP